MAIAAQNGTARRHAKKSQALKEDAAKLHVRGLGNQHIARRLGVKAHAAPQMLEDSESLKTYRHQLRDRVPKAMDNLKKDLNSPRPEIRQKATLSTLANTQVRVRERSAI